MQYLKYFVLPIILGIFIISCEKDDPAVIDNILNFPTISNAAISPNTFDSDTINALVSVQVSSVDPIKEVRVTLTNPDNGIEQVFQLQDAGLGTYSAHIVYVRSCRLVGSWRAEFIAETVDGLLSNTEQVNFTVINTNNQPPVLSDLIAPDSLRRATGLGGDTLFTIVFLQVKATDPNGNCDVADAYFNSFSPSGFANPGNPFFMYDDGNILAHGDSVAGDNKFSLIVAIPPNPNDSAIGNFTFKFNAKDRGIPPAISDTLTKIIRLHR